MNALTPKSSETSMAFVLESISTVEQSAQLEGFGIASPFTSGPAQVNEWLVDRDRGLYFLNLGGNAFNGNFLAFADRDGVLLRAAGHRRSEGEYVPAGVDEFWKFDSISIPKEHASRESQIVEQFREALEAYGTLGDAEVTRSVSVDLVPPKFV